MDSGDGNQNVTEHVRNKHKIQELSKPELHKLLDCAMLSAKEREIMRLLYAERRSTVYVAMKTGYAESTVRLKHKQIVEKLSRYL